MMGGVAVAVIQVDKRLLVLHGLECKKIEAWTQKEIHRSQYYGCTVAYVYKINMRPKGNETDAMSLSQSSWGSWPGQNP